VWLVARDKCWTAIQLARQGLSHPERCPLYDQAEETINHLLVVCVIASSLGKYGSTSYRSFNLQALCPQSEDLSFDDW
jgi:hypothetical protein